MLPSVLSRIAAIVLLAVMLIGTADVVGRFLFSAPLPGASELVEVLMAVLVFSALPALSADRGHVSIGLVEPLLKGALLRGQRVVVALLTMACLALFAWCALRYGLKIAPLGDRTDYLGIPKAPIFFVIAAACVLAAAWVPVELFRASPSPSLPTAHEAVSR